MNHFIKITLIFSLVLFMSGCQTKTNLNRMAELEATKVLERYLILEEKQNYKECYNLFSSSRKISLQKEYNVKNADEYDKFFKKWEAFWSNSKIKEVVKDTDEKAEIIVRTIVEEAGETEAIEKIFFLITEQGKWKIDDWKY